LDVETYATKTAHVVSVVVIILKGLEVSKTDHYLYKKIIGIKMNQNYNCNLTKCVYNMNHSIALCLGVSELEYDYMDICWLRDGVIHSSLNCSKYKESDKEK